MFDWMDVLFFVCLIGSGGCGLAVMLLRSNERERTHRELLDAIRDRPLKGDDAR